MRRAIKLTIQYLMLLLGAPLVYSLWLTRCQGQHRLSVMIVLLAILSCYTVTFVGTNVIRLWEFHIPGMIGHMPFYAGIVLGTSISLETYLCLALRPPAPIEVGTLLQLTFLSGSVVSLWNWVFDIFAIKTGTLTVYIRSPRERWGAASIAGDYAPLYFFVYGAIYAAEILLLEDWLLLQGRWAAYPWLFVLLLAVLMVTPFAVYALVRYLQHGDFGVTPQR